MYRRFQNERTVRAEFAYICFEVLYWTGMREGELLALSPADIDLDNKTISINRTYQRIEGKDVFTSPKTRKSKRKIG